MVKDHGPHIKKNDTYESLLKDGASKQKAARIANAQANPDMNPSEKGGKSKPYEERSKEDLRDKAKEIGIAHYSTMTKGELINALRNH